MNKNTIYIINQNPEILKHAFIFNAARIIQDNGYVLDYIWRDELSYNIGFDFKLSTDDNLCVFLQTGESGKNLILEWNNNIKLNDIVKLHDEILNKILI